MEAADDISYLVADIEDAFVSHIISYEDAVSNLLLLSGAGDTTRDKIEAERERGGSRAALRLARAMTIGACIRTMGETLRLHYTAIMSGTHRGSFPFSLLILLKHHITEYCLTFIVTGGREYEHGDVSTQNCQSCESLSLSGVHNLDLM